MTRARGGSAGAEWAAVSQSDPAFEDASSRFFQTDPGNRLTFDHMVADGPDLSGRGTEGVGPEYGNGAGRGQRRPTQSYDDGVFTPPGSADVPWPDPPQRPDRTEQIGRPGDPPGRRGDDERLSAGYDAISGEPAFGPDAEVDDDELATGAAARRNAIEWAVVLVAAVLLALVLRALVLQAFYIPSPSMQETLLIQDRVLVNKLSYRFGEVSRGDIVVFHRTDEEIAIAGPNQPKDVIKRVIALGGEKIEIRESTVFINDVPLDEPYLKPGIVMPDFGPLTVPDGFLFVMGDNRNLSSDSRGELGPIAEDRVVGRAFVLFWPVNRLDRL